MLCFLFVKLCYLCIGVTEFLLLFHVCVNLLLGYSVVIYMRFFYICLLAFCWLSIVCVEFLLLYSCCFLRFYYVFMFVLLIILYLFHSCC